MDAEHRAEGQRRVREHLIERCDQAGMTRNKKNTIDDHKAMVARLVALLAYMDLENLITLAELVIDAAGGPKGNQWPDEATVRSLAKSIQPIPVTEHRIVTSWLASVEGPEAVVGGFEVELFWHLKKHRRPPNGYAMKQIREHAADNARRVEIVRGRISREVVSPEDQRWLEDYLRVRRQVRSIIKQGEKARKVAA